jgi:hypothetical protein
VIVLDTNVISAVMRRDPSPSVLRWLDERETTSLFLTSVTLAEIRYGLRIMPDGRRRRGLEMRFEELVSRGFQQRLLAFDETAAHAYAEVMAHRKEIGRPMSAFDGQIAGIARSRGFAVATGNVRDFEGCGLEILNPFSG